jgi:ribosomal protein S27AE
LRGRATALAMQVEQLMPVTRTQILARGLTNRCPNCGGRTLFQEGTLFRVNRSCPRCGLPIERDEGSFLGAMSLNYGVTIILFLVPVLLLYLGGLFSGLMAAIMAGAGAVAVPALLYRSSRSWWLMNYYFFVPHHLPANQRKLTGDEDANT